MLGAPPVRGMRVGVGVGEAGAVSRRAVFRCDVCLQEPGGSGSGAGAEHLRGKGDLPSQQMSRGTGSPALCSQRKRRLPLAPPSGSAWVSRPQVEGFLALRGHLLCPLRQDAGTFQPVWELERELGMQKGPDVQAGEPGGQVLGFGEREGGERGCRGGSACPLGT